MSPSVNEEDRMHGLPDRTYAVYLGLEGVSDGLCKWSGLT